MTDDAVPVTAEDRALWCAAFEAWDAGRNGFNPGGDHEAAAAILARHREGAAASDLVAASKAALAAVDAYPATPMDELQRLGQEYDDGSLGQFGHHPEPAIDFEYEVEQIESIVSDLEKGMRQGEPVPLDRIERAMTFRVGGDPSAVAAKETLRRLEQRAKALSAPMVQEGLREAAQAVVDEAARMTMTMRRRKIFDALAAALADRTQEVQP